MAGFFPVAHRLERGALPWTLLQQVVDVPVRCELPVGLCYVPGCGIPRSATLLKTSTSFNGGNYDLAAGMFSAVGVLMVPGCEAAYGQKPVEQRLRRFRGDRIR
jgi:hypothetical protein